jgi:hypothetical protein
VPFRQSSSGGQVPGEYRDWRPAGYGPDSPSRGYRPTADLPRRGEPGSRELHGLRGPDADRDASGHYRPLQREVGPHAGRGPKNYRRSDERIWGELCDRLMAHPDIDASEVDVVVAEGRVTFTGTVPDRRTRHRIEDLAEGTFGVVDVDDHLRVRRSPMTPADDAAASRRDEH